MPSPMMSLMGPTESHSVYAVRSDPARSSAYGSCLISTSQRRRQAFQTVCEAQQDHGEGLGRGFAAVAASTLLLLSSGGPAWADASLGAAETSNATVQASAGVSAVLGEQNQALQRASNQAKREVLLDINSDGQPLGRVAVELFNDVPVGALRFYELAEGYEGISYQLSKFSEVAPGFIRVADLQSLTYAAEKAASIAGGETVEQLEVEQQEAKHTHDQAGMVSLVIKDARQRPTKERLVAYNGRLVTVQEQQGAVPNGSGFVITTAAQPALDATNLVIGRIVSGMPVVEQIAKMPAVKANKGSPFFKVAKLAGDKRADVAEKGFGRPFSRVVIAQSGVSTSKP